MTKRKYISYLAISGAFTFALLLKLWAFIPDRLYVILDFIAMLGGGVFCSTLVSWFIEVQNGKKEDQKQDEQRNYILSSARNTFLRLYERELFMLSSYITHAANNSADFIHEPMNIKDISSKLTWILSRIESDMDRESGSDEIIITADTIRQHKLQNIYLVSQNEPYYKSLNQHLSELSTQYTSYYISGIFSEAQIDSLKSLSFDIHDILVFSQDGDIGDGSILEFKKMLFENTAEILPVLGIPEDTQVDVRYRNIF